MQLLNQPRSSMAEKARPNAVVLTLDDRSVGHCIRWAVVLRILPVPEVAQSKALVPKDA